MYTVNLSYCNGIAASGDSLTVLMIRTRIVVLGVSGMFLCLTGAVECILCDGGEVRTIPRPSRGGGGLLSNLLGKWGS